MPSQATFEYAASKPSMMKARHSGMLFGLALQWLLMALCSVLPIQARWCGPSSRDSEASVAHAKMPLRAWGDVKAFPPSLVALGSVACPCSDPTLCAPIDAPTRKELVAFQVNRTNWHGYRWDLLTTVVLFDGLDPDMLCHAHAHGVRVVWGATFTDWLGNATARDLWVASWVAQVRDSFTDGINFDFEWFVCPDTAEQAGLTLLVTSLSTELKAVLPSSQLSFDVVWRPDAFEDYYDYAAIISVCDFVVIMDYDTRLQVEPPSPCIAGPNAPYHTLVIGLQEYLAIPGVDPTKLVLGVPWYGVNYGCVGPTAVAPNAARCPIKAKDFRGCPCTDQVGVQWPYWKIQRLLPIASRPLVQNVSGGWATFNFVDQTTNQVHQIWFDTPLVLRHKYLAAKQRRLRGLSMWTVDSLDPVDAPRETAEMWDALTVFF